MSQGSLFDPGVYASARGLTRMQESLLPKSDWVMPDKFPDLSGAKRIAIDIESRDPHLQSLGPGFVRGDATVIGVSVATDDGFAGYYPVGHSSGDNLDRTKVMSWLKTELGRPDQTKVGANLIYDMNGLASEGVVVRGQLFDIQVAEALIDEESATGYALNALATKYLGSRKDEDLLQKAGEILVRGKKKTRVKGEMHRLPARFVGPYAETDAILPLSVMDKQVDELNKQDLWPIFKLESRLTHLLLAMHRRGVRVDLVAAEQLNDRLKSDEFVLQKQIDGLAGVPVDVWSGPSLKRAFEKMNLPIRATAKGNPSFTADYLQELSGKVPFVAKVLELRKMSKMRRDFVESLVLQMNVRGRIHAQFHQLKNDEDGTRTGRLSCTNPNLQQIPIRDPVYGPLVRGLFIPEDGCLWGQHDYSAQEPRLTVHYAGLLKLPGAEDAVRKYNEDPNTDYHQMVANMANITRKHAKIINLGLAYGMGRRKLALDLGFITLPQFMDRNYPIPEAANELFALYHEKVPFVGKLAELCTRRATNNGAIRTLLGRVRHFNLWEPARKGMAAGEYTGRALPREEAVATYGGMPLQRAYTHKGLNSLIQGSAADMVKKAMLDMYDEGIVPHVTMHDEIDDSHETRAQFDRMADIMRNAVKLLVPIKVDSSLVENWGVAE